MLGPSVLRASMGDLSSLAARGLERQAFQPTFMPQTRFGMAAQFDTLYHRLADQLRTAERDARHEAATTEDTGQDGPTAGRTARKLKDLACEATIILGHRIPNKDLEVFNQMIQDGYMASVSLLLDVVEAGRLDDMVYQAFLERARRSQDGRITLDRSADGSEQWQISGGDHLFGTGSRPLEKRRYEPVDQEAFDALMARVT
jgi:hypothetical protein